MDIRSKVQDAIQKEYNKMMGRDTDSSDEEDATSDGSSGRDDE